MEENLDMIYQLAGKAGIKNLGNFDEFKTRMVKSENQAMLHGLMSKAGVKNLGNLKEFSARITQKKSPGVSESSPTSSVPVPVAEPTFRSQSIPAQTGFDEKIERNRPRDGEDLVRFETRRRAEERGNTPSTPVEETGTITSYGNMFHRMFYNTVGSSMLTGVAELAYANPLANWLLGEGDVEKSWTYQAGKEIENFVNERTPVNPEIEQSILGQVVGGLGQAAGMILTMPKTAALGLAKTHQVIGGAKEILKTGAKQYFSRPAMVGALQTVSQEADQVRDAVKTAQSMTRQEYIDSKDGHPEAGMEYDKLTTSDPDELVAGIIPGAFLSGSTEAIPLATMFSRLDKLGGKWAKKRIGQWLTGVAAGTAEGATQEMLQEFVTNASAKDVYDFTSELTDGLEESAAVGGGVQLILEGVLGALGVKKVNMGGSEDIDRAIALVEEKQAKLAENVATQIVDEKVREKSVIEAAAKLDNEDVGIAELVEAAKTPEILNKVENQEIKKQVSQVARAIESLPSDFQDNEDAIRIALDKKVIDDRIDEIQTEIKETDEALAQDKLNEIESLKLKQAEASLALADAVGVTPSEKAKNLVVHAEEGAGIKAAPSSLPKTAPTIDDIAIKVAMGEEVTKAEKEMIDQNREAFDARMDEMSEQEAERIKKDVRPLREKFSKISETVEDQIAEAFANDTRLNTQSYDAASDPTFRKENPSIGLKYLSKDGTQIDVWAQELADKFGIDEQAAQEKIVNFINQNQSGVGDYMRGRIESVEPHAEAKQSTKIIEELGEEDAKVLDDFLQRFEVDGKLDEEGLRKAFEEAESGFSPEFLELQAEAPKAYEKLKNLVNGKSKNVHRISGEAKGRKSVQASTSQSTNQNDSPARRVAGRIGKAFPGIEVVFGAISNIPAGAKKMGNAGYYHNGKIFIDESLAGSDTPIHEFGHLWQQLLKLQKPHLLKQAAKLAKETEYFKQVQADPEYQNLTEEEQADEAIARAIGDEGKKWLEAPAHKKVWRAIMDALRDLLSAIGYRPSLNVASMTFRDLTKTATREILSKTPITQASSLDVERALSSGFALQFDDSVLEIAPKNKVDKLISIWNRYLTTTKGIGEVMRNKLERGHNEQRAILNEVKMTSDRFWGKFEELTGADNLVVRKYKEARSIPVREGWAEADKEKLIKDIADVFSGKAVITVLPESIRTELENLMRARDHFRAKMLDNLVRDGKVVMNEELGMLMTRNFEAEGNLEDALGKIKEEYDKAFEAAEGMNDLYYKDEIGREFDRFSIKKKLISLDIAKLRLQQTQALLDRLTARAGDVDARTQKLANKLRDVRVLIEKSIEVAGRTETAAEKAIGKTTRQVEKDRKAILDKIPEIPEAPMTLDEMDLTAELELAVEELREMNQPTGGVNREGLLRLIDKTEAAARHLEEKKMSGNETVQVRFKDGEKIELELTQRDGSVEKVELDQKDAEIFFSQLGHDMLRRVQYDKEGYIDIRNPKVFLNNPLYEKIRANKNYVNRSYMKHDVKDFEQNLVRYIGQKHYDEAYNFIQKTYSDHRITGIRRAVAKDGSVRYYFQNSFGAEAKLDEAGNAVTDGYVVPDIKEFLRTAGVSEKDINAFSRYEGSDFFRLSAPASKYRRTGVRFSLTHPEIQAIIGKIVSVEDLDSIPSDVKIGNVSVDTGALKKRKDIPEPIRNLMGEYLDPRMTVGRTLIKAGMIAEQTRFNMDFLQDGLGTWISEERTSEHNKKITKANMPHLGEGKEYWTTEEVYDALFANDQIKDRFVRGLVILSGLTKANLTVYKNDSQARNFWGAALNMAATGNWGAFGNLGQAMRVVSQDFTEAQSWGTAMSSPLFVMRLAMGKKFGNKGDQRWVDAYKEAVSYGLVESSAEIGAIEDALNQIDDAAVTRGQKVMKKVKEVTQVFSKPYQMSDAIFKVAAFQAETQRYMEAGFSEQEAKDKAAEIVKNTQPTYGRAARVFRIISRAPLIGNFILFRVEMMRTRVNIIKLGMEEIKSGNPTLVKSGITRLTSVSIMAGVSSALALAAKALVGMDDEEEEAIRRDLPDYMDNSDLVWLNNDFANPKYLDFSFIDPTSDFHRAARAAMRGEGIGRVLNAGDEMFSGMLGLDIFLKEAGEALVTNQDEYGRKIRNEEDYLLPQAWDVTKHITDPLVPGLAKNVSKIVQAGLISAGVMKEDEIYKLKMTDELMNNFVGVKVKQRDLQNHFSFKMSDFADRIKESEKIPNPGRSEKRRQELFREALNIYNYQPFILSSSEIEDAFKSKSGRITDLWLYRALVAGELPEKKE